MESKNRKVFGVDDDVQQWVGQHQFRVFVRLEEEKTLDHFVVL